MGWPAGCTATTIRTTTTANTGAVGAEIAIATAITAEEGAAIAIVIAIAVVAIAVVAACSSEGSETGGSRRRWETAGTAARLGRSWAAGNCTVCRALRAGFGKLGGSALCFKRIEGGKDCIVRLIRKLEKEDACLIAILLSC